MASLRRLLILLGARSLDRGPMSKGAKVHVLGCIRSAGLKQPFPGRSVLQRHK